MIDWNVVGAIGELLGAVAVVITVLYLAAQIRENTRQTALQLDTLDQSRVNNAHEAFSRFRSLLLSSQDYPVIWKRALDGAELTEEEIEIADFLFQEHVACYQLMYMAMDFERSSEQRGVTDVQSYFLQIGQNEFQRPGAKALWHRVRHRFEMQGFEALIDNLTAAEGKGPL